MKLNSSSIIFRLTLRDPLQDAESSPDLISCKRVNVSQVQSPHTTNVLFNIYEVTELPPPSCQINAASFLLLCRRASFVTRVGISGLILRLSHDQRLTLPQ